MTERSHAISFDYGDLSKIEIPVVGPDGKNYILREAMGGAAARYKNARTKCARFKDGGLSGADGLGNLPELLLHLTLFTTKEDGTRNPKDTISKPAVAGWPNRVIEELFTEALKISELDDAESLDDLKKQREELDERIAKMEEDSAKNVPSDTETGLNSPESEDIADL